MTLITDPDNLNQGTEIDFHTGSLTIQLYEAGNLSTDGVTMQCLYSFCKEEWKGNLFYEKISMNNPQINL